MSRVLFSVEEAFLIRSTRTKAGLKPRVMYYETPSVWSRNPALATIFRTFEAASGHMAMFHDRDSSPKGWADGSKEILDVVTLHAAIIEMKQKKGEER